MAGSIVRSRLWSSLLVLLLLAAALPATAAAAPAADDSLARDEPAAQTSDSPCTGATTADYTNDPCGPSLTIPQWGDVGGWDDPTTAETIQLIDLNGDGHDELVGLSPQGLMVNTWNSAWGQWVPANNQNQPFAFANGSVRPDTIRFGPFGGGQFGAVALAADGSGLETWFWMPGDGSPGSGSWELKGRNGPFSNTDTSGDWTNPAYYSTIQFMPDVFNSYLGLLARGKAGLLVCLWAPSATWGCEQVTTAFNDAAVTGSDGPADYYYGTIQFTSIGPEILGPVLVGRDNTNGGGLKAFVWEPQSDRPRLSQLSIGGVAPFDSTWNAPQYASTIGQAKLVAGAGTTQLVGRGPNGPQWWTMAGSGCSGGDGCWNDITNKAVRIFTDNDGYTQPQYYATVQFSDVDGDGLDEAFGRDPQTGSSTWALHASAGWTSVATTPTLTAGPSDDPLWSNPSYYATIHTGDIDGDGDAELVARGKYGIRTWTWQGHSGWGRPLPYGFSSFATTAQDNTFALLNSFLAIESGNTIRDSYTSPNSGVMSNYVTCLNNSIANDATMPPAGTCDLLGPVTPLSNPNGVTAADWQAMVTTINVEIAMVNAVNSHFNVVLAGIFTELFELDEDEFSQITNALFPTEPPPSSGTNWLAIFLPLVEAVARSIVVVTEPELAIPVNLAIGGVTAAMAAMQTPQASTVNGDLRQIQAAMLNNATAMVTTNTDFFNYAVQDGGLLNLYGTLLDNQMWEIQAPQRAAAIANGRYEMALWLYQTILYQRWAILICVDGGNQFNQYCGSLMDKYGNLDYAPGVNAVSFLYLSEGGSYSSPEIVDSHDQTLALINQALSDECSRAPTDADGWTYGSCGMGIPITSIIPFDAIIYGGVTCPTRTGALQLECNLAVPPPCVFNCPPGASGDARSRPVMVQRYAALRFS